MLKLEGLIKRVIRFNQEHGWHPAPVDSAKSIVIEAAELLEHFQWDESSKAKRRPKKDWEEIKLELADILWYIIAFSHEAKLDIAECLAKKIEHNKKKYPAEMFNGRHNEDFYRKQKRKYREKRGG
jgi:dCTP diphosphatase